MSLNSASVTFADAFDFAQNHLAWRFVTIRAWPMIERLVPRIGHSLKDCCKTLDDYVYDLIDERQAGLMNEDTEKCKDLLVLFMQAGDEKGSPLSRTELKDAAMNMIIAGRSVDELIH